MQTDWEVFTDVAMLEKLAMALDGLGPIDRNYVLGDGCSHVAPRLRQIAEGLEAGSVMPRSDAVVNFGVGSRPVGHICYRAVGMACSVCDAKGADRMTATEVVIPPGVFTSEDIAALVRGASVSKQADYLAHLGLAKAPPEPCICPPGAVSRSCRAVGFRSGIMHKDRE